MTDKKPMPDHVWVYHGKYQLGISTREVDPLTLAAKFPRTRYTRADLCAKDVNQEFLEALKRAVNCMNRMSERAYAIKLEGQQEWDEIAGVADMYGALDECQAVIAKAVAQTPTPTEAKPEERGAENTSGARAEDIIDRIPCVAISPENREFLRQTLTTPDHNGLLTEALHHLKFVSGYIKSSTIEETITKLTAALKPREG